MSVTKRIGKQGGRRVLRVFAKERSELEAWCEKVKIPKWWIKEGENCFFLILFSKELVEKLAPV